MTLKLRGDGLFLFWIGRDGTDLSLFLQTFLEDFIEVIVAVCPNLLFIE